MRSTAAPLFRDDCSCLTPILSFAPLSNLYPSSSHVICLFFSWAVSPCLEKRDEISCENWSMQDIRVLISIRDSTHSCTPTWERGDRYQIDTPRIIWQVLSTRCAPACVSWLLIKWMPPGPDLQLKDSVVTWTTEASTCKPRQLTSYLFISHTL